MIDQLYDDCEEIEKLPELEMTPFEDWVENAVVTDPDGVTVVDCVETGAEASVEETSFNETVEIGVVPVVEPEGMLLDDRVEKETVPNVDCEGFDDDDIAEAELLGEIVDDDTTALELIGETFDDETAVPQVD